MAEHVTDEDFELLGKLGIETEPTASGGRTAKEQRIIAGFEEIERFVEEHGRLPEHGEERDIFERLYAVRLDRLRESLECREVLKDLDPRGLLRGDKDSNPARTEDDLSDEELLATLGIEPSEGGDVTQLVHVRSRDEIKAAEEIAQRTPCADFDQFKPLFEKVQQDLEAGERQTAKYGENAGVKKGDLFHTPKGKWSLSPRWATSLSVITAAPTEGSGSFTTTAQKVTFSSGHYSVPCTKIRQAVAHC